MPTKSPAQKRLMQAAAHTKGGFGGVPQKVGKEFIKPKRMAEGGVTSLGGMLSSTPNTPTIASRDTSRMEQRALDDSNQLPPTLPNPTAPVYPPINPLGYKKGGHITTRRVSSVTRSKNSPSW